jgi:hypothetical protein
MFRKFVFGLISFALAFVVLSVSVIESISVNYVFATPIPVGVLGTSSYNIEYYAPYPGRIRPDNILWPVKAGRDRLQYLLTPNPLRKAELALRFSDKRVVFSKELFEEKKPDTAFATLTKGEKYLEEAVKHEIVARERGIDTADFLQKLATASLKHRQIIEEILPFAPEDAKPGVVRVLDYSKNSYKSARDALNSLGRPVPVNPFNGDY